MAENIKAKAQVDFKCMSEKCDGIIKFNLMDVSKENLQVICPKCHSSYDFDEELRGNMNKLKKLILAVREAEHILGDCNVSVNVPGGEVKVPYALLLTRLNTMITLEVGGKKVDFHLWVEPSSPDTFR
ncbi:MAG: hypothetical protein A2017_07915 [Lentisphaerae bacterium GWF2_44_16]|nr:MAG: hypothetical protein A2017_07915 [Lentisphaerae bacterium GWF2_44_16]